MCNEKSKSMENINLSSEVSELSVAKEISSYSSDSLNCATKNLNLIKGTPKPGTIKDSSFHTKSVCTNVSMLMAKLESQTVAFEKTTKP